MNRSARELARFVLGKVEEGSYATLALAAALEKSGLSAADRGLATELVYGVLRHRTRIDRALQAASDRRLKVPPKVHRALRVATYQLLFLDRVPAHAAVNDGVEATKKATPRLSKFANAILRAVAAQGEPAWPDSLTPVERAAGLGSMPSWLVTELASSLPETELEAAALAFVAPPAVVLRCLSDRREVMQRIADEHPRAKATASRWCPDALLVEKIGELGALSVMSEGQVAVQDVGAQLVTHMVSGRPQRILDACAGQGGKTLHLCDRFPDAEVVAADESTAKLQRLCEAAVRLGRVAPRTVAGDLRHPDKSLAAGFDAVVLDAPCSGLGVLRRHPERKWREHAVGELTQLQRSLLAAMAKLVAPGGQLIYSVCTFAHAEGRDQVRRFLEENPEFVLSPPRDREGAPPWSQLLDNDGFLVTWPHRHDADAFFAARLERRVLASAT